MPERKVQAAQHSSWGEQTLLEQGCDMKKTVLQGSQLGTSVD